MARRCRAWLRGLVAGCSWCEWTRGSAAHAAHEICWSERVIHPVSYRSLMAGGSGVASQPDAWSLCRSAPWPCGVVEVVQQVLVVTQPFLQCAWGLMWTISGALRCEKEPGGAEPAAQLAVSTSRVGSSRPLTQDLHSVCYRLASCCDSLNLMNTCSSAIHRLDVQ